MDWNELLKMDKYFKLKKKKKRKKNKSIAPIVDLQSRSSSGSHEVTSIRRPFTSHRQFRLCSSKFDLLFIVPKCLQRSTIHTKDLLRSAERHKNYTSYPINTYHIARQVTKSRQTQDFWRESQGRKEINFVEICLFKKGRKKKRIHLPLGFHRIVL